ncbi:actin-binding Rho-activating protein-like [Cebidichthys violaceus]|uniref:actin-binding Rho-activating protein-like n=1 Tax=Cebidichthys violaceus TaxID=271503 RepID=UPI0035CAF2E6
MKADEVRIESVCGVNIMEAEDHVPDPARFSDDAAACIVSVKGLKENWQKWSDEHREYQKHNPFSQDTRPGAAVPQRGRDGYGRPPQGSVTEQRGKDAHTHVSREVEELCQVIRNIGQPGDKDGDGRGGDGTVVIVEFGKLFERYVTISNKLVGILLRARKQGLVDFEGEMLWQRKDDHALITLLQ